VSDMKRKVASVKLSFGRRYYLVVVVVVLLALTRDWDMCPLAVFFSWWGSASGLSPGPIPLDTGLAGGDRPLDSTPPWRGAESAYAGGVLFLVR
jgi:hypothetical protein